MKVFFSQIYIETGANFPFNHLFQRYLAEEITRIVEPSPYFAEKWGSDFNLMFRISAKRSIQENEIKGPTVFKKTKDIEFTIFLPFPSTSVNTGTLNAAIVNIFHGVFSVLTKLKIDTTEFLEKKDNIILSVSEDQRFTGISIG